MDKKQAAQEEEYGFPYHHIPHFKKGRFSHVRMWPWGYMYLGCLEATLDYIGQKSFTSLLDIGCGDGRLLYEARKLFPHATLVGNDYSEHAIALAKAFNFKNGVQLSTEPTETLVAQRGLFDVVVAFEVLEHIPLDETNEFCRSFATALKPGGTGIVTVPCDNIPVNHKHYQHFNEHSLKKTLEPHLRVTKLFFLDSLSKRTWLVQRLLGNKFFILNHPKLVTAIYNYYRRHLLHTTLKRCTHLMAVVEKY
ncbi:MAG: class I SAM-dependent methyltransferase [Candidatus Adlerbacteria bacterium]|nr:class I SAM-dependent methyltransferase [Candidatus Adlerbacteria bacterium]